MTDAIEPERFCSERWVYFVGSNIDQTGQRVDVVYEVALSDVPACGAGPDWGCACTRCAPHEQKGILPPTWKKRIRPRMRCGRPRRDGLPCRSTVKHADEGCPRHLSQPHGP
jgi:hypothetical protein